ncbi:MAG: N-glycosylase/DNA lyase [Methanoregula sp. PtaU1.Bin051]|nr:MAG: N-glycosylase/DNA lyase [Methanoregula sp. PtaU1.Bin051]
MKAIDYENNLNDFLKKYNHQPNLTKKLDNLPDISFTQSLIDEIVLWKIDRYVSLDNEILLSLDNLKSFTQGRHQQAQPVLETLLKVHGVDLPMASTFLRFRNPRVFQIIDKHAYRAVYDKKYPLHSKSPPSEKISTYFDYLDKLIKLCRERNLEFQNIDRLLYMFDKRTNGKL